MRYYVVTVFTELVERFCEEALLGKAQQSGRVTIDTVSPRDFTTDRHRSIDDTPYGGGSGMVMMPGPVVRRWSRPRRGKPSAAASARGACCSPRRARTIPTQRRGR